MKTKMYIAVENDWKLYFSNTMFKEMKLILKVHVNLFDSFVYCLEGYQINKAVNT